MCSSWWIGIRLPLEICNARKSMSRTFLRNGAQSISIEAKGVESIEKEIK